MNRARVFLVEDHPTMRAAIGGLLARVPDVELIGSAASAEDASDALADADVELVLVDVSLPGASGIELVRQLSARDGPPCLVVSGHTEVAYVRRSQAAGARGYVAKGDPDALLRAVEAVLGGGSWFDGDG